MQTIVKNEATSKSSKYEFSVEIEPDEQRGKASINVKTSLNGKSTTTEIQIDFEQGKLSISDLTPSMSASSCLVSCGISTVVPAILQC